MEGSGALAAFAAGAERCGGKRKDSAASTIGCLCKKERI